jgi:hypothetical protein
MMSDARGGATARALQNKMAARRTTSTKNIAPRLATIAGSSSGAHERRAASGVQSRRRS